MVEPIEEFYCLQENCAFLHTNKSEGEVGTDAGTVVTPIFAKHIDEGYECVQLSQTAGFILRLLLQQLGIPLVRQVLLWKYPGQINSEEEADQLIRNVIARYANEGFIRPMRQEEIDQLKMGNEDIDQLSVNLRSLETVDRSPFNKLFLDASINQIGPIVIRITFPPMK